MWAAIIAAVGALAGAVISAVSNKKTAEKTMQQQKENQSELTKQQNDFNVEMWNKNNEYNSPSEQIQRYYEAGINPAGLFGGGSIYTSTPVSGTAGSATAVSPPGNGYDFSALEQILPLMLQTEKTKAEVGNLNADKKLKEVTADKTHNESLGIAWDNRHKQEAFDNNQNLVKATIERYSKQNNLDEATTNKIQLEYAWLPRLNQAELNKVYSEIDNIKSSTNYTNAKAYNEYLESAVHSLRSNLASSGINPDSRGFDQFMEFLLEEPDTAVKRAKDILVGLIQGTIDEVSSDNSVDYSSLLKRLLKKDSHINPGGGRW